MFHFHLFVSKEGKTVGYRIGDKLVSLDALPATVKQERENSDVARETLTFDLSAIVCSEEST
jgi:hypothetical protein